VRQNPSAVPRDDCACDREIESCPAALLCIVRVNLRQPFENSIELFGRNTVSVGREG
jgi:hypothetical protein